MGKSSLNLNIQRDYVINGIDAENNKITNLTAKIIKPIFEEKFLLKPNRKIKCRLKKNFKYRDHFYYFYIFESEINFSIVISRTGKLHSFLVEKSDENRTELKNENSNLYEISTISRIQFELFEKIFLSIDSKFLQEIFFNIFELYLKKKTRFINGKFFKFNNEIMYKIRLQGTVEFVVLADDTGKFIDILSGKEKSEYSYKIKEAISLGRYKNTINLL